MPALTAGKQAAGRNINNSPPGRGVGVGQYKNHSFF